MGGFFNLALGFTVQHAGGGDALYGQDDVTRTQVGIRRPTARSDLEKIGCIELT